jgi:hypothetical protein
MIRWCAGFVVWLAVVAGAGFWAGQANQTAISGAIELPPCPSQKPVHVMIVDAAWRHGLAPQRALARAWNESKYQQIDSACCRGVFQIHKRYFPAMPIEANIEAGVSQLAALVQRYGKRAEHIYQYGHYGFAFSSRICMAAQISYCNPTQMSVGYKYGSQQEPLPRRRD